MLGTNSDLKLPPPVCSFARLPFTFFPLYLLVSDLPQAISAFPHLPCAILPPNLLLHSLCCLLPCSSFYSFTLCLLTLLLFFPSCASSTSFCLSPSITFFSFLSIPRLPDLIYHCGDSVSQTSAASCARG